MKRSSLLALSLLALAGLPASAAWNVIQLTDNEYDDTIPQISGDNVVWSG